MDQQTRQRVDETRVCPTCGQPLNVIEWRVGGEDSTPWQPDRVWCTDCEPANLNTRA